MIKKIWKHLIWRNHNSRHNTTKRSTRQDNGAQTENKTKMSIWASSRAKRLRAVGRIYWLGINNFMLLSWNTYCASVFLSLLHITPPSVPSGRGCKYLSPSSRRPSTSHRQPRSSTIHIRNSHCPFRSSYSALAEPYMKNCRELLIWWCRGLNETLFMVR